MSRTHVLAAVCIILWITVVAGAINCHIKVTSLQAKVEALEAETPELGLEISKYERTNESLDIITFSNDLDYHKKDFLGIAFDTNEDGKIANEGIGILYADNTTISGLLLEDGTIALPLLSPTPSSYHTCVFEAGIGYTFNVSLPLSMQRDLVYMCFHDYPNSTIHVQLVMGV